MVRWRLWSRWHETSCIGCDVTSCDETSCDGTSCIGCDETSCDETSCIGCDETSCDVLIDLILGACKDLMPSGWRRDLMPSWWRRDLMSCFPAKRRKAHFEEIELVTRATKNND